MEERVILVDENDNEIGTAEKLEAHRKGLLHRAFSIFIFHPDGKLLLQKRARTKYHSDGLWSNTCCSHPRPGEPIEEEVQRRLRQEMGFSCPLQHAFQFTYKATVNNGLIENELDHVFIGRFDGDPVPNPQEADGWKWIAVEDLKKDLHEHPEHYSYWLKICIDPVLDSLETAE